MFLSKLVLLLKLKYFNSGIFRLFIVYFYWILTYFTTVICFCRNLFYCYSLSISAEAYFASYDTISCLPVHSYAFVALLFLLSFSVSFSLLNT